MVTQQAGGVVAACYRAMPGAKSLECYRLLWLRNIQDY